MRMEHEGVRSGRRHRAYVAMVPATVAVAIASQAALLAIGSQAGPEILGITAMLVFTVVGALILDRRPGQPIGRVCLAMGLMLGASTILKVGAIVLDAQPGRLPPVGAAMAVVSSAMASSVILLGAPLLIGRFPDDTRSRRQRVILDVLIAIVAVVTLSTAFRPGPLELEAIEHVENPLGVSGIPLLTADDPTSLTIVIYAAAYLVATVQLALRYRSGGSIVRAQIRWFGAAIGTTFLLFVAVVLTGGAPDLNEIAWVGWIVSLLLPPIAIAIAILRYRLYDIDRIVSRTVGYAVMSVVLFTVFAAVNLALQNLLSGVTSGDALPVAVSTLFVASLFNRVRAPVQHIVDRRFHRSRTDADRTATEFASRLRDELDVRTLTDALASTTSRALEPSIAVVWLRARGGQPG